MDSESENMTMSTTLPSPTSVIKTMTMTAPADDDELANSSRILPEDYKPGDNTVVIGRGRKIKALEGNQRLVKIVKETLPSYSVAGCKTKKSGILVKIVNQVRDKNPDRIGFVKLDAAAGRWHEVSLFAARTSVAQVFRDTNHVHYRSSKQSKQRRRKQQKMEPCSPSSSLPSSMSMMSTSFSLRDASAANYQGRHHHAMASNHPTAARMMRRPVPLPTLQLPPLTSFHPATPTNNPFPLMTTMMMHPQEDEEERMAAEDSRSRLCSILDEAVRCADLPTRPTPVSDASFSSRSSRSSRRSNSSRTSSHKKELDDDDEDGDPFEPLPLQKIKAKKSLKSHSESSVSSLSVDEDEEEDDSFFRVFDKFSASEMRKALIANKRHQ